MKMQNLLEQRKKNYHNNLVSRGINPNAIIHIDEALKTLNDFENKGINYREEIQSIKKELSIRGISNERAIQLRAKWGELSYLVGLEKR